MESIEHRIVRDIFQEWLPIACERACERNHRLNTTVVMDGVAMLSV